MKKTVLMVLSACSLFAEDTPAPEKVAPKAAASKQEGRTLFSIDPKSRANDFVQAFSRAQHPPIAIEIVGFMLAARIGLIPNDVIGFDDNKGNIGMVRRPAPDVRKIRVVAIRFKDPLEKSLENFPGVGRPAPVETVFTI